MNTVPNRRMNVLIGDHDPSMGDERERDVILRASTLSSVLAMYPGFIVAIFLAASGLGFASLLVLVPVFLPIYATYFYARNERVDLADKGRQMLPRRRRWTNATVSIGLVAVLIAIGFHRFAGHPLIPINWNPAGAGPPDASEIAGVVTGAVCGGSAVLLFGWLQRRRARKRELDASDED